MLAAFEPLFNYGEGGLFVLRLSEDGLLADDAPDGGVGGFVERERRDAEDRGEMAGAGVVADIE